MRDRVWDRLQEEGAARFPFPPNGRIPNFDGADEAADRLDELKAWRTADTLKCNPDSPQKAVRRRALDEGKTVFMAVPKLRDAKCFFRLDPGKLGGKLDEAATIIGASKLATQVGPDRMDEIDLVVAGSVAVDEKGGRVGKGGGYSDLEFAIARSLGLLRADTPVLTTVHELQVVDEELSMQKHDVPMDYVLTPGRAIRTETGHPKPEGVLWDELEADRVGQIPVLDRLRQEG